MSATGTGRRALALLRERQWVLAALGVVALSVVFTVLGRWQYDRHEGKVERRDLVTANYAADPVPLESLLPTPQAELDPAQVWRPVEVSGEYLAASSVLVRNRPLQGVAGYEVLVPLRLSTGALFLVDRGWVPAGADARLPDAVPAPPTGPVSVTARLRLSEPALDREPPAGQALRIDVPGIAGRLAAQGLTGPFHQAYGVLAAETPAVQTAPRLLPRPEVGLGINFAYAVQWWAFAVAAYVLLGVAAVREVRRREPLGPGHPAGGSGGPRGTAGTPSAGTITSTAT